MLPLHVSQYQQRLSAGCVLGGVLLALGASDVRGETSASPEGLARLVRQLGHEEFAQREAASRELARLGESAADALRQAARNSDPEIRWRAAVLKQVIEREHAAVKARQQLAQWQGAWLSVNEQWLNIEGDEWRSGAPNFGAVVGKIVVVELRGDVARVDVQITGGPTAGQTCKMILRREGELMHYCGTYDAEFPAEFKTFGTQLHLIWKPTAKKSKPPRPEPVAIP
jgi:hypothetical protein